MTILTRYILSEFLRILFFALVTMVTLFVVINFFETVDEFVTNKASVFQVVSYYFYKLPLLASRMAPVAFLLATVIAVGALSRNSEITAMKSCGISLMRVSAPILCASLVYSIATAVANEFIIPYTTQKSNHIFRVDIKKQQPRSVFARNKIWYRTNDGSIWQIGLFDAGKRELHNITIFSYEGKKNLNERVDATKATWEKGGWIFSDGSIRTFNEQGTESTEEFQRRRIYYPLVPGDLAKIKKREEERTLKELYDYAQKVKKEGMDNRRYIVDLHHKLSYPFISLVTALIGIPFSLRSARSGGVLFGVGISMILGFSYNFIFSLGISLGYGGTIPPFFAAWGINLIFTAIGLYLILTLDSETNLPQITLKDKFSIQSFFIKKTN